ncbi:Lsr2 family protein [Pseudarthrobacter sp. NamE5]|uniref:histone-like nucleoid-structuring protein Lsr2 n=1 Tax=Pseudarthrobacter sp. NamE5 TaxID=2576839 RepID=UPI00110B7025|nr:Lsr2 family protein [Pseudarthrobacter sp. NamE5]TLM83219.1 Lsr2 family protein [Pseudarthrobacter sp. NamE5]
MALKAVITLEDDIDGSEAVETITFALDGDDYEIDLSAANAEGLREAMKPYVSTARKTTGRKRKTRRNATRPSSFPI